MLIDVNGVMPMFKDKVIQYAEAIDGPYTFKLTDQKGSGPQSMVFECETDDDPKKVAQFLKGAIKKAPFGASLFFQVVPHGQYML